MLEIISLLAAFLGFESPEDEPALQVGPEFVPDG